MSRVLCRAVLGFTGFRVNLRAIQSSPKYLGVFSQSYLLKIELVEINQYKTYMFESFLHKGRFFILFRVPGRDRPLIEVSLNELSKNSFFIYFLFLILFPSYISAGRR